MYLSLYRKWRPRRFDEMVGQDHVANAIRTGFLQDKLAHAYLFTGSRGTGKTTAAKLVAKLVNCAAPESGEPCNKCESCINCNNGHEELSDIYEIDAASNRGIDEIRELRDNIKFAPLHRKKVYIIDEVHMLTNEAFNALLKTLEEPPSHVLFILATTDPRKIPSTVLSRCQRFDFKRLDQRSIVGQLGYICEQEGFQVEEAALSLIAGRAEGGLRDAISLLDQCASAYDAKIDYLHVQGLLGGVGDDILLELLEAGCQGDLARVLEVIDSIAETGANLSGIGSEFNRLLRELVYAKEAPKLLEGRHTQEKILSYQETAGKISSELLAGGMKLFLETENLLRFATDPRLVFEAALIEFTMVASGKTIPSGPGISELSLGPLDTSVSKATKDEIKVKPLPEPPASRMPQAAPKVTEHFSEKKEAKASPGHVPSNEEPAPEKSVHEINRRWQQLALKQKNPILKTMLRQCTVTGFEGNKLVLFSQNPSAVDRLKAKRADVLAILAEVAPGINDFNICEAKNLTRDDPPLHPAEEQRSSAAKEKISPVSAKDEEPVMGIALREFEATDVTDEFKRKED